MSHSTGNIATVVNNNSTNICPQSTLDDGGNCLLLNGPVEPKTLRTLLKGLNSSFSGVDNLIDTINRFEHTTPTMEQNDNLLIRSIRTEKSSSTKRTTINTDKPSTRRRTKKKLKQEQQQVQLSMPLSSQPIIVEQQNSWQTDFNSFDFSMPWTNDTNLNSLLLNDDFDTAASFDDVNFGDFEPYMNGNNDLTLPSLFVKSLASDGLPNLDHLLS